MSTNTTSPNEPTRNGNLLVNQQDVVAVARVADNDKEFISSRTTFVVQESPPRIATSTDDSSICWAERLGLVRYLPTLHDAALLLAQIGGRL